MRAVRGKAKAPIREPRNRTTLPARERLLVAAEQLFAQRGYNGVSTRNIAAAAAVNLGTIPYYFGTKEALFREVFERLVKPMLKERCAAFEKVLSKPGKREPDVKEILEAGLVPVFTRSRKNTTYRLLAGRSSTDPTKEVRRTIDVVHSNRIFPQSLHRACPHLSDEEFYWRYFCLHGAVQYVLADIGRIQRDAGKDFDTSDPKIALKYVIPFLVAGLMAPPVRQVTTAGIKNQSRARGAC